MDAKFKKQEAVPLYSQLVNYLEKQIISGILPYKSKLPTERELSQEWGLARNTIRKSFRILAQRDLITQRVGKGSFVSYHNSSAVEIYKIALLGNAFVTGLKSEDLFFSHFVSGVYDFFSQNRMTGIYYQNLSKDFMKEYQVQNLSGIMFFAPSDDCVPGIKNLKEAGIPHVITLREENDGLNSITIENYRATLNALEYLYKSGHRRIAAILKPPQNDKFSANRVLDAWHDFMKKKLPEGITINISKNYNLFEEEILPALQKNKPTAIFCGNIIIAFKLYITAYKYAIRVPDDVSIVSFGDYSALSCNLFPRLTAVKHPVFELGYQAAAMLLRQIKGHQLPEQHMLLNPEFVIRDSCREIKNEKTVK